MTGAKEYAKALFLLTEELGTTESALNDVNVCKEIFESNPSYVTLTDTPALTPDEKISLISEAFSSVDASVINLIKILCEKHSVYLFSEIAKEYVSLYNDARGICPAEVISAIPLDEGRMSAIKSKLEALTGKTIIIKNTVEPSVLGGIKLRYMGKQLDGSLKSRLDKIDAGLKNTIL